MIKTLPVFLNSDIQTECFTQYKLSIILSDKKYYSWFMENFIYYFLDDNYNFEYESIYSINFLLRLVLII